MCLYIIIALGGTLTLNSLFLPEVFAVVKVPGGRMAHHLSTLRLHQHGSFPELIGHLFQTQRDEELLGHTEHVRGIISLQRAKTHKLGQCYHIEL